MISNNRGVSMVVGTILVFILIVAVVAAQVMVLQNYNEASKVKILTEEVKLQESVNIIGIENKTVSDALYIEQLVVKNTGSNTIKLRAIYIDNKFLFDPSEDIINPNGNKINPNATLNIFFNTINQPLDLNSLITIATERGTRSVAYVRDLLSPPQTIMVTQGVFGPLKLEYEVFDHTTNIDQPSWEPGWQLTFSNKEIIWRINATNVSSKTIELNKYSSLVLMPDGTSATYAWHLATSSVVIQPKETVSLVFKWDNYDSTKINSINTIGRGTHKVFIAFFGTLQPETSFGQTVPFQSVVIT